MDNDFTDKEDIQVLYLAPVSELLAQKDKIKELIFGVNNKINKTDRLFSISPTSGWLNFTDETKIWKSENSIGLSTEVQEIVAAAETFLDETNRKVPAFNKANNATLRGIFPDRNQRQLNECKLVKHPEGPWADHWLCTYEITILAGTAQSQRAYVYGMGLDIRIGRNKEIIAFSSRWLPAARTIYTPLFPKSDFHFLMPEHEHAPADAHDEHDEDASRESPFVYLYDGDCGNQYYVAPYYYLAAGHHLNFAPASKYSLVVAITQEDRGNESQLTAKVYGGSGAYSFNWGYWNPSTLWEKNNGVKTLGEGITEVIKQEDQNTMTSSVVLKKGFYTIMLHVTDLRTAAYKYMEQSVFTQENQSSDALVS